MGHPLDPWLDQVRGKYSADLDNVQIEAFEEGAAYIENLILDWADEHGEHETFLRQLVAWTRTRPSR